MVLKTFNVDQAVYARFSRLCKDRGMNMSKQVELFMKFLAEEDSGLKEEYLKKLEKIRHGPFVRVNDFGKRYGV